MRQTRRQFLKTIGLAAGAAGVPRLAGAQAKKPITVTHSVSTFV